MDLEYRHFAPSYVQGAILFDWQFYKNMSVLSSYVHGSRQPGVSGERMRELKERVQSDRAEFGKSITSPGVTQFGLDARAPTGTRQGMLF